MAFQAQREWRRCNQCELCFARQAPQKIAYSLRVADLHPTGASQEGRGRSASTRVNKTMLLEMLGNLVRQFPPRPAIVITFLQKQIVQPIGDCVGGA